MRSEVCGPGERGGLRPVGAYLAGAAILNSIGLLAAGRERPENKVLHAPEM
jgi:hypothetical protein